MHHDVSWQMSLVVANPDASHPSTTCSFDTSKSVFHNNASVGQSPDARGGNQIHFRIRFSTMHILSGDDALKDMGSRQSFKDCFDIRTWCRRSDRLEPSLSVKPVHPICNPGQGRDAVPANELTVELLFGV